MNTLQQLNGVDVSDYNAILLNKQAFQQVDFTLYPPLRMHFLIHAIQFQHRLPSQASMLRSERRNLKKSGEQEANQKVSRGPRINNHKRVKRAFVVPKKHGPKPYKRSRRNRIIPINFRMSPPISFAEMFPRPGGLPGTMPAGFPGTMPVGQLGTMPVGFPGTMPVGQLGTMPVGFPGTMPVGLPGTMPAGFPGTRPVGLPRAITMELPGTMPVGQLGTMPVGQLGTMPVGQLGTMPVGFPGSSPVGFPSTIPVGIPGVPIGIHSVGPFIPPGMGPLGPPLALGAPPLGFSSIPFMPVSHPSFIPVIPENSLNEAAAKRRKAPRKSTAAFKVKSPEQIALKNARTVCREEAQKWRNDKNSIEIAQKVNKQVPIYFQKKKANQKRRRLEKHQLIKKNRKRLVQIYGDAVFKRGWPISRKQIKQALGIKDQVVNQIQLQGIFQLMQEQQVQEKVEMISEQASSQITELVSNSEDKLKLILLVEQDNASSSLRVPQYVLTG